MDSRTEPATSSYSSWFKQWLKPANLPMRLNSIANVSCLISTLTSILTGSSKLVNDYLSQTIPQVVNGLLNAVPTVIPFVPNLFCCKKTPAPEKEAFAVDAYEKESTALFAAVEEGKLDEKMRGNISKIKALQKVLLDDYKENKKSEEYSFCDNFINLTYLITQTLSGILVIMQAVGSYDDDTNQRLNDVSNWIDVVSNITYLLYMVAIMLPKRCKKTANERVDDDKAVAARPTAADPLLPRHLTKAFGSNLG